MMKMYSETIVALSILIFLFTSILIGVSYFSAKKDNKEWGPKNFHVILLVIACAMLFFGSKYLNHTEGPVVKRNDPKGVFKLVSDGSYALIIKDTVTGCEFFYSNSDGRIIPRPDSTGKQICKR